MYKHVISLGFFCSVSLEMERIGLRDASYPFDWLISDLEVVVEFIENDFSGFLKYENLAQYKSNKQLYVDLKYNLHFYHDFNEFNTLENQLPAIQEKYRRRISRFNKDILEPTLFIRYIQNQDELNYIDINYQKIINLLRSKNGKNDLILVSNDDLIFNNIDVFKVEKDENDTVCREFLLKNEKLNSFLCSNIYDETIRKNNIKRYNLNQKKKKVKRYTNYIPKKTKRKFMEQYDHNLKI